MQPRWNYAESAPLEGRKVKTGVSPENRGAGSEGTNLSFQSREKYVLDIPSYRSGDVAH
jgi:hypothetical protein